MLRATIYTGKAHIAAHAEAHTGTDLFTNAIISQLIQLLVGWGADSFGNSNVENTLAHVQDDIM